MLKTADIEMKLMQREAGQFQKICNEILCKKGYKPFEYTGSVKGTNKTKLGTPDSVFVDKNEKYIYVEITTQTSKLKDKIKRDVKKCLDKIQQKKILDGKVSKIIFMHNSNNPDESFIEEIKKMCGKNIKFEIYGINYLSNELQNDCKDIAISLLELKDDDIQSIKMLSDEDIDKLSKAINKKEMKEYKDKSLNDIKNIINDLYQNAANIVNNDDSIVYISSENKTRLKSIFDSLKAFDFYYNKNQTEDSKIYYHNMFIILSKSNLDDGINFYSSLPEYVANSYLSKHFYSMLLLEKGNYKEANSILEQLYFENKYELSFETLLRSYFLIENYDKVVELLSIAKKEKFDRYGFMAAMIIIAKNNKKKLTKQQILKLNNSKFKSMPIFYSCTSKLLYMLNNKDEKYKEQFKKGIKLLNPKDIVVIETMCNQAVEMGLENDMISYLESIKLSNVLEHKFLQLISNKKVFTKKDIEVIEKIDSDSFYGNVDKDYIFAKISESKGKELESIKLYRASYENNSNTLSIFKYIQLSIKNRSTIDEKLIVKLSLDNSVNSLMLCAQAYDYIGKIDDAINCSYKAIYLSENTVKYNEAFRQFWSIIMFSGDKNYRDLKHVVNSSVIILKEINSKKTKTILLEDDNYFIEGNEILGATITRTYSDLGVNLLGMKKGNKLFIGQEEYVVNDISDKYTYLVSACFKYVKENKYLKFFTSDKGKPEDSIEQIRREMIEVNNSSNKRLDIYQESSNIPLSALISNNYDFDSYAKLINTLLIDSDRILLAGENCNIDLKKGFVIDISTLIIMSILDMLDLIPENFYNRIYVTTSLKNKFQYFYESLIRKQNQTEKKLCIVANDKLSLSEINVIDQIKFWKKLNNLLNKVTVVDVEFGKDGLYNDKTKKFFDKVQFDLIMTSKQFDLPFVCDDLMIRKVSNKYEIKHTNLTQLIKEFSRNDDEFEQLIIKLIKHNYIYALYDNTLSEILKKLYSNFNDECKNNFELIISSIFENRINMDYYVPILLNRLKCIKNVQYIKILDQIYENLFATFYIETIENEIKMACNKFNIDSKNYEIS